MGQEQATTRRTGNQQQDQQVQEHRQAVLIAHKDHKAEQNKTKPIGTANMSNTRGFANLFSDLLKAIANSEKDPHEVILSEDMIHMIKLVSKQNKAVEEDKKQKSEKMRCNGRKIGKKKCKEHDFLRPSKPPPPNIPYLPISYCTTWVANRCPEYLSSPSPTLHPSTMLTSQTR